MEVVSGLHPGFSGSLTVLVDGGSLFPASGVSGLGCRLYEMPEGPKNSPTEAMLRKAVGVSKDRASGSVEQ